MSRKCEISGKRPLVGNNVSHSKRRTKRRQEPNLQAKRFFDPESGKWTKLRVAASVIRTIRKKGLRAVLKKAGK